MMHITALKPHLTQNFAPVYADFDGICADARDARLLAELFRWTEWAETNEPERGGWIRKSAKDLKAMLLSRRAYEGARRRLTEMGLVACERARETYGRLVWRLDVGRLAELIFQAQGRKMPAALCADGSRDADGFRLPDFVPLPLWQAHQAAMKLKNKHVPLKTKKAWLAKLEELHKKGWDIALIMQKSIERGWFGFFDPTDYNPHHNKGDDGSAAALAEWNKLKEAQRLAEQQPKPPDKPDKQPEIRSAEDRAKGKTNAQRLMEIAKSKKW